MQLFAFAELHKWLLERNQMLGSLKWFTDVGGYGFIEHSDGPDVFVHYSDRRRATRNLE